MAVDRNGFLIQWEGLQIVSGEGTGTGTIEPYTGKRTLFHLAARLKHEQAGGDRWAFAQAADGTRYSIGGGGHG